MTSRALHMADLYRTEHGRLRSFVRRIVGNHAVADDLVQQAFTNLLARAEPAIENRAYVGKAVRNLALNHLRNERRRAEVEIAGVDAALVADPVPSPEMTVLFRSELRKLLEAILQLPERRRETFMLSRVDGLSHDAVAARMGVSRNTVISQIVAAMADLERLLANA